MNRIDWEKTRENINVTDIVRINSSTWFTAQSEYSVREGNRINGTHRNTTLVDNSFETFQEGNETTIYPDSAGEYAEWGAEVPTGVEHWDCCNEDSPDDEDTYVQTTTQSWRNEAYSMEDIADSGNISWVRIYIRAKHADIAGPQPYIRTLIRTYETDYLSEDLSLTESYKNLYTQYDTNPFSGAPWTWEEIDALEAGASGRSFGNRFVRLTTVWIIVGHEGWNADVNGDFPIDVSTYPLAQVKGVEIQIKYRANDIGERWYLEAYNWTAGKYSDSGFNFTIGQLPTTGWDYYAVNITGKWQSYIRADGSLNIKFHDADADENQTTIDIDFLAVRVLIEGTSFSFTNKGAVTCHIVSIWIVNSTTHTRYETDIYVNAGETSNYIRPDISLPANLYFVKVTTERGNIAIYLSR